VASRATGGRSPAGFTAQSPLTSLEIRFVEKVERGENFIPNALELRSSKLRGGLIRAILLGTPLAGHPRAAAQGAPVAVSVTSHGIRIAAAEPDPTELAAAGPRTYPKLLRIEGPIDLQGIEAAGAGTLPGLQLSGCQFEGVINLSGARLQSLHLTRSRFSRLIAVAARFSGGVLISDCGPRGDAETAGEQKFLDRTVVTGAPNEYRLLVRTSKPWKAGTCHCGLCAVAADARQEAAYNPHVQSCNFCCEIDLETAEIGGTLEVTRTYLRAGRVVGRRYATPKITDRFAAYLDGVKVGGSIVFKRSVFVGRCSLRNATVGNDIWVHGGKYVASAERATFDFQLASIAGLLTFRTHEATTREEVDHQVRGFPVVVIGHISGISLEASEVWIAEGFYFGHDPLRRGGYATINFGKADIARTFKVGSYHEFQDTKRPSGNAWIQGEICLTAANLGKNLEIHGADYEGIFDTIGLEQEFFGDFGVERKTPHLRLSGQGIKVDRRAYISKGRFRDIDALPRGARRGRKPSAVDFWKSTIGTGLRMERETHCIGAIRLNSCVIGREVIIRCSKIEASPQSQGPGPTRIRSLIDISESSIDGHVKIGRLVLRGATPPGGPRNPAATRRADEASNCAIRVEGGISLKSTRIVGSVVFGHVTIDLSQVFSRGAPPAAADVAEPADEGGGADSSGTAEPLQLRKLADEENDRIAIDLRGCDCGADLEIRGMRWKLPPPRDRESRSWTKGWWKREAKAFLLFGTLGWPFGLARFRHIHNGVFAVVDLRGFRCATLLDGFGADWGFIYRIQLRIAGIRIDDVEPVCHRGPGPSIRPEPDRLRWLASQHTVQHAEDISETQAERRPRRMRFAERFASTWRHDFVPHALQVFSSAYRRAGEDLSADRILAEKKDTQNALNFWRLVRKWYFWSPEKLHQRMLLILALIYAYAATQQLVTAIDPHYRLLSQPLFLLLVAVLVLWPFISAAFQLLFKAMFIYGLSAERGLLVFGVAIGIGWAGVHDWRDVGSGVGTPQWRPDGSLDPGVVLVLDVPPQPADASPGDIKAARVDRVEMKPVVARPSPCDTEVSSLLYALDTFLPLIDLDQERRCTIRSAPPSERPDPYLAQRVMKALYELAGWLVTSLLILTVTGVLRRDLER
jgi:hypothetical protein